MTELFSSFIWIFEPNHCYKQLICINATDPVQLQGETNGEGGSIEIDKHILHGGCDYFIILTYIKHILHSYFEYHKPLILKLRNDFQFTVILSDLKQNSTLLSRI
jgi:hypothetical protein